MSNPAFDLLVERTKLKSCFNFQNDLQVGEAGESFVSSIFKDKKVKLEVKKDDWAVRSGNIAIEFECRGKPSGIQVTEADFWCHVVGHYFILVFPVDFLRRVFQDFRNDPRSVKEMGDPDGNGGRVSKAILVPWRKLLELFENYQPQA